MAKDKGKPFLARLCANYCRFIPQAAEMFLKTHDDVFASRPKLQVLQSIYNGKKGIAFTEHESYWRSVRKLCSQQLFTVSKIESFASSRKELLTHFIESLKKAATTKEVVNISKMVGNLNEKMTLKMILGLVEKWQQEGERNCSRVGSAAVQ
ncbi:hypothetical protein GOBAR_AA22190 [Gossypium barbadense]|uniref:Cytochrome P450 n=1 Tax=Gossypium barbadense TaxID=3634 RepID=A0A2P5X571_GOSBA|nr:hypothetical protein GOBAR_AA22190 [Gossypium barbadense]